MNYQKVLQKIERELKDKKLNGEIADYIPELARVSPHKYGLHLNKIKGKEYSFGDSDELFSIQSISKVFTLTMTYTLTEGNIWHRVNVEPSGNPFNSLIELERDGGIPRNPFINSGALVVADILVSLLDNPKEDLLFFIHRLTGDSSIMYDKKVMHSERETGFRNVALVNYMKALGNIKNHPEEVLDLYYHQCSIAMNCRQLAQAFMVYANQGKIPHTGESLINHKEVKRINALMQTCGFYDEAGEFTFRVGLPGKSGVGGGIVALHPGKYAVAVWSPPLNKKGNSTKGMKTLEMLTEHTDTSIF